MQKRKCCRTGINLISALGMLFLVLGLATSQIYLHTPKSLIALAELHPSEIKSCSININRTSGSSVDLYGEGLEPFLELMEVTDVGYTGVDVSISPDIVEYIVYLEDNNRKNITMSIFDNGFIHFRGRFYKIINENIQNTDVVKYLRCKCRVCSTRGQSQVLCKPSMRHAGTVLMCYPLRTIPNGYPVSCEVW